MTSSIEKRLTSQLKAKGMNSEAAKNIARKKLQEFGNLKADGTPTAKGEKRGAMTPGERAKDREASYSGHSTKEFKYNSKTNRATLKKGK